METHTNRRRALENYVEKKHLKLEDLIRQANDFGLSNSYLYREDIPDSPKPEFHVSHLKHETTKLQGIRKDEGFRSLTEPLVWWSLAVGPEEVRSAESRLLEETFPERTEEQRQQQQSFLWRFTTSPAFLETSRLGSYRFTFPLKEVMKAYSEQFCSGAQPVMRVYRTVLYKQEVMHSVLVHSPATQRFSDYPLLTDDPNAICAYQDGHFIWRPEAMSETHRYELIIREDTKQMEVNEIYYNPPFYVWDNIAVAFHVEDNQVLTFGAAQLRRNLKYCQQGPGGTKLSYDTLDRAQMMVRSLWPDMDIPLEKTRLLEQSFTDGPAESALSAAQ